MHTDKLISRIKAVLNGDSGHFEIQTLAIEYADMVMIVRDRLEQCVALIRAGNDYAALQVAESPPALLDTAAQLAFLDAPEWINLCREKNLPYPSKIDQHHVDLVNSLYGKQISESHPLYRNYRQAIRERDDLKALGVLASILRVNPGDKNARAESIRLSQKTKSTYIQKLEILLAEGNETEAFELLDALELASIPGVAETPAFQKARELRENRDREQATVQALKALKQAAPLYETNDWQAATPLLARARSLERDHRLVFEDQVRKQMEMLENWAAKHQNQHAQALARQEAIRHADNTLATLVHTPLPSRFTRTGLKSISSQLDQAIAQSSLLGGDTDQTLILSARERRKGIARRIQRRDIAFVSLVALCLASLVVSGLYIYESQTSAARRDKVMARMVELEGTSQLLEAEDLLKKAGDRWDSDDSYIAAKKKLANWVNDKRSKLSALLNKADQIKAQPLNASTPESLAQNLAAMAGLRQSLEEISPDTRAEANAAVSESEAHLQEIQSKLSADFAPAFAVRLDEIDRQFINAIAAPNPRLRTQALVAMVPAMEKLNETERRIDSLLPEDIRTRWKSLNDRVAADTAKWDQTARADTALAGATSLATYLELIRPIVEQNVASKVIVANETALLDPVERLITPAARKLWRVVEQHPQGATPFLPPDPLPAETVEASRLAQSKIFQKLWRYTFQQLPVSAANKPVTLYTVGQSKNERLPIGDGYELRQEVDVLQADGTSDHRIYSMRQFGGLEPRGELLTEGTPAPESNFLIRFSRFYDRSSGRITEPLLATLDRIRDTQNVSALLKAYLQQEILRITENRPDEWGIIFSPTAQKDSAALAQITQNSITLNDWLYPERWADRYPALQKHYAPPQPAYLTEATAYFRVFLRLAKPGFVFVGYMNSEGRLHQSTKHLLTGYLVGLTPDGRMAVCPAEKSLGELREEDSTRGFLVSVPFVAYSPVLMLSTTPAEAAKQTQFPEDVPAPAQGWEKFVIFPSSSAATSN